MFVSTQIDKIKRNAEKYKNGWLSTSKFVGSIVGKPLYYFLLLLLTLLAFYLCFVLTSNPITDIDSPAEAGIIFSENVLQLYDKLMQQLAIVETRSSESIKDKLLMPENKLYQRTKAVQALYDYIKAATREIYADQYSSDAGYHHIECLEAFSHGIQFVISFNQMQHAVEKFINTDGDNLYSNYMKKFCERAIITQQNSGGLSKIIGQYGIIATQDIDKNKCVGHFYGDEYILPEYEEEFSWDRYGQKKKHPFKKKWDYYMTIAYDRLSDKRLKLRDLNITVALDAYHMYNYQDYVKYGGQNLTNEQGRSKQNYEPLVNDARLSLYKPRLTAPDRTRKNVEFVYCSVDGVIHTFLISHAHIEAKEQLFTYYGPNYGK